MPRGYLNSKPSVTDLAIKRRLIKWLDIGIQNENGNKRRRLPAVVEGFRNTLHFQDKNEAKKKIDRYLVMVEKTIITIRKEIDQI